MLDDGTIDGAWGGDIDDEGNKTQYLLIKNGFKFLFSRWIILMMKNEWKRNGLLEDSHISLNLLAEWAIPLYLPGKSTPEEIIANTKYGLYAKSMGGGSVSPATGEFNFAVNEGYLIQDGKITHPVRGATLIGSGKDILLNIDMVGNDLKRAQGMCGSSSGMIPADVGQPTIRVSEITVGGTGGEINND